MSELGPVVELDLLHPTGRAAARLAIGGAARAIDHGEGERPVDLVVVAPRPDEVSRAWLLAALATAADRMAHDAVAVVIAPRRWRRTAERAIAAAGLVPADAVVTAPVWPDTKHFLPIAAAPLADGGPRYLGLGPFRARLAGTAARLEVGRRLMRRRAVGCALVARRRTGSEPFAWLAALDGAASARATVSGPTRADAPTAVVLRYPVSGSVPDLAIKVALDDAGRRGLARERTALTELAPAAARAGVEIPTVNRDGPPWLLSTTVVRGAPASSVLARRSSQLERVARALVAWLTEWNRATASPAVASADLLDRLLLDAADRVTASDTSLADYRRLVGDLALRVRGQPIVLVTAHHDLTMANVLDGGRTIGILDWEAADSAALPTTDLWYALADGAALACRISHAEAVEALVLGDARLPSWFSRAPAELASALSMPPDEGILAFHACWLHHAANEVARGERDGRFLAVVRSVATRRLLWPEPAPSTRST
jgi:hypothetical protein